MLAWAFSFSCIILRRVSSLQPAGVFPGSIWWRRCVERPMMVQTPCVLEEPHHHTSLSVFLTYLLFFYSVPGRHDESKEQLILLGIWAPAFSALRSQLSVVGRGRLASCQPLLPPCNAFQLLFYVSRTVLRLKSRVKHCQRC